MRELFSKKLLLAASSVSFIYFLLAIYIMNLNFVSGVIQSSYPLGNKIYILASILKSSPQVMNWYEFTLLLVISVLTGLNFGLVLIQLLRIKQLKKVHVVASGSSILGIAGSGCVSCGLSVIALVGLGGSIAYLPFRGAELSYLSVFLLLITLLFFIKNGQNACKIRAKRVKNK